jgi:hypothetical protein
MIENMPSDHDDAQQPEQPDAAEQQPVVVAPVDELERADVEWQAPFWGRAAGTVENVEMTSLIRGAIKNGKLRVITCGPPCDTPPSLPIDPEQQGGGDARGRRRKGG